MHVAEMADQLHVVAARLAQLLAVVARVGEDLLDRGALVGQQIEHLVLVDHCFRIRPEVAGLVRVSENGGKLLTDVGVDAIEEHPHAFGRYAHLGESLDRLDRLALRFARGDHGQDVVVDLEMRLVILHQLGQKVLDVGGADVDDGSFCHQQLAKEPAKLAAAHLFDSETQVSCAFVGRFDGNDLGVRNAGCQQVAGGHSFAYGAGIVYGCDFHWRCLFSSAEFGQFVEVNGI
ncbi:hypothetical protein D3C85_1213090 [compost metagenome]